jgi:hypothetical protein
MAKSRKKLRLKSWLKLSPEEKVTRIRALEVLRLMKNGKSFTASSKSVGIKSESAKQNLSKFIYKRKRKWHAKKVENNIQRELQIYEKGKVRSIVVRNSKDASLIGQYYNDVKHGLMTGDWKPLQKYKKHKIRDVKGKTHKLEINPSKIQDIELAKEEPEFFDIYET